MTIDVVAIFDSSFRQILQTAIPMRASVTEEAILPEHTLENGSAINDHKIFKPVIIELTLFLNAAEVSNTYQALRQLYRSEQLVTIQTRTGSYSNMTISTLPHEQTADMVNSINVNVKFKEVMQATAQFGPLPPSSVRRAEQSSTIDRGEQLPGSVDSSTASQGSFLYRQFAQ